MKKRAKRYSKKITCLALLLQIATATVNADLSDRNVNGEQYCDIGNLVTDIVFNSNDIEYQYASCDSMDENFVLPGSPSSLVGEPFITGGSSWGTSTIVVEHASSISLRIGVLSDWVIDSPEFAQNAYFRYRIITIDGEEVIPWTDPVKILTSTPGKLNWNRDFTFTFDKFLTLNMEYGAYMIEAFDWIAFEIGSPHAVQPIDISLYYLSIKAYAGGDSKINPKELFVGNNRVEQKTTWHTDSINKWSIYRIQESGVRDYVTGYLDYDSFLLSNNQVLPQDAIPNEPGQYVLINDAEISTLLESPKPNGGILSSERHDSTEYIFEIEDTEPLIYDAIAKHILVDNEFNQLLLLDKEVQMGTNEEYYNFNAKNYKEYSFVAIEGSDVRGSFSESDIEVRFLYQSMNTPVDPSYPIKADGTIEFKSHVEETLPNTGSSNSVAIFGYSALILGILLSLFNMIFQIIRKNVCC